MSKLSECEFKMNRLFKREKGYVDKDERGSFIVGKCYLENLMYVSFGWNIRDVIFVNKNELEEVVLFLSNNGYKAYHTEDMNIYVNKTEDKHFLEYRAALPGPVLSKEEAMM
jgi:hypothetical protein